MVVSLPEKREIIIKKGKKKVENWIAILEPVGPQFTFSFILKEQVSEIAQA